MTIASHCLALLHERGPLTAEELGAACLDAGVTASRQPDRAVISALSWDQDGRAFRVGVRFHAVTELLEGRWLTFPPPADDSGVVDPDVDLACLTRLVEREGLPLAGGGMVKAARYHRDDWNWPDGWLPAGETLGLRLIGGVAHLRAVTIDDAAKRRGEKLAALLTERHLGINLGYCERRQVAGQGLLALLANHDDVLRDPVPPLSTLLPAPPEELRRNSWDAPPPFWPSVQVHLSPELHDQLDQMARSVGEPIRRWLAEQLEWLADWPMTPPAGAGRAARSAYDGHGDYGDYGSDVEGAYGMTGRIDQWNPFPSVLPFPRPRGVDPGAS